MWDVTLRLPDRDTVPFISTHTSRVGCDKFRLAVLRKAVNISTHTSRVGCDLVAQNTHIFYRISTHTSRVGCDKIRNIGS